MINLNFYLSNLAFWASKKLIKGHAWFKAYSNLTYRQLSVFVERASLVLQVSPLRCVWLQNLTRGLGFYDSFLTTRELWLFSFYALAVLWSLGKALTSNHSVSGQGSLRGHWWLTSTVSAAHQAPLSLEESPGAPHPTGCCARPWVPSPSSTGSIPPCGHLAPSGKCPLIRLQGLTPVYITWTQGQCGKAYPKSPAARPCHRASYSLQTVVPMSVYGGLRGSCYPES